jgi:hypothetical protein
MLPNFEPKNKKCITPHGGFLEGVYEIELDTKTEYEGFEGTISTFQNGYFKKNRRSRFSENPFLGTVPTPLKSLFFTNFLQRANFKFFWSSLDSRHRNL